MLGAGESGEGPQIHAIKIDTIELFGFQRGHQLGAVLGGMVN